MQSTVSKDDGLQVPGKNLFRHSRCFIDVAAANAQIPIDHWRVIEHEKLFACGRSVLFNHFDVLLDQSRSQLAGIRNRGGTADELRIGAIESRDSLESPEHVRQMAAEHPTVGVQFIEDD